MPHHPSSAPGSSKKKCSCGRSRCTAPEHYRRLLEVDDQRALLEAEVQLTLRRLWFLDKIREDREQHFAQWHIQEQEYEQKMYQAWIVAPGRRWHPHQVDLFSIQSREVSDWYQREAGEISHLLQAKREALKEREERLSQQQQALSRIILMPACSHQIAQMARAHLRQLREKQDHSRQQIAPLKKQQVELTRTYDALCQRFQQRQPLPHQEGKKAVNIRFWLYVLFGIGRPTSRSAQVSLLDQEHLTEKYQQECELQFGFLWFSRQYWQLGKALLIEDLLPVLAQRYQLAETFLHSHLRAGKPHP